MERVWHRYPDYSFFVESDKMNSNIGIITFKVEFLNSHVEWRKIGERIDYEEFFELAGAYIEARAEKGKFEKLSGDYERFKTLAIGEIAGAKLKEKD